VNVVVLGATRGMGRALARLMAERGDRLFLLGRDPAALDGAAADLEARGAVERPGTGACDLERPNGFDTALDLAWSGLGRVDAVVVTAGLFGTQEALEADRTLRQRVLAADFANTIDFCELARRRLLEGGGGTLCVFSSVAGDRARRKVGLYGAAKAGLSHYLDALDLSFRDAGLRTVLVKPGFVRTGMTQGLEVPPFAADPDRAAADALRAIDRGRRCVYVPAVWRLVMCVVRLLPRGVLRRSGF